MPMRKTQGLPSALSMGITPRRVDHVEILRGIRAPEYEDRELTAGMLREKLGDVKDLLIDDDKGVALGGVLCFATSAEV